MSNEASSKPVVWLDLDQTALDDAYDQSKYATNIEILRERNKFASALTRANIGEPLQFAYGQSPIERLDVFKSSQSNAPINVFIHGGAWKQRSASDYHFLADLSIGIGAHFVAIDFVGVDRCGGRLQPMFEQVRRALIWIYQNAALFDADPHSLYLSAHSSGGHLAGRLCVEDWSMYGLPSDLIKGAVLCSGIYDLRPVRLSKRSQYVTIDDATEADFSTQRHVSKLSCPVLIAYGTHETPEFQRQSNEFFALVKAAGKSATLSVGQTYNHFEMLEIMANPHSLVGRATVQLITQGRDNL